MKNCSQVIADALKEFRHKWDQLYQFCILRQKKWMESNHSLATGNLVLITDLLGKLNYPRHGVIAAVEPDSVGVERYFIIEYKAGNKTMTVKRTAQSLVLVLKKSENEQAEISDSLFWHDNEKDSGEILKKTIKVTVQGVTDQMYDL